MNRGPILRRTVTGLKFARQSAGLRQRDVADAVGISIMQLSRLERGLQRIRDDVARELALLLGVDPDFLAREVVPR